MSELINCPAGTCALSAISDWCKDGGCGIADSRPSLESEGLYLRGSRDQFSNDLDLFNKTRGDINKLPEVGQNG